MNKGETELKDFLDVALQELMGNGHVDNILAKYQLNRDTFYPVAHPYGSPLKTGRN